MNEIQQRQNIARGVSDSSRYSNGGNEDGGALALLILFLIGAFIYSGLK